RLVRLERRRHHPEQWHRDHEDEERQQRVGGDSDGERLAHGVRPSQALALRCSKIVTSNTRPTRSGRKSVETAAASPRRRFTMPITYTSIVYTMVASEVPPPVRR